MKKARIILTAAVLGLLLNRSPAVHGQQNGTQTASPQKPSFQVGMYRVKNSLTMNLLVEKKLGDQLVVMLLDERGRLLYKGFLGRRQQKYSQLLNFGEAGDGTYTVVVKNGAEQLTRDIRLSTQTLYEMPRRLLIAEK